MRLLGLFVCRAGKRDVLRERQEPAAVGFSFFFERNNFHSLSGAPELFSAETVRRSSLMDEGCRRRSVSQNVRQEGF
jgi:hypothetical protein